MGRAYGCCSPGGGSGGGFFGELFLKLGGGVSEDHSSFELIRCRADE